MLDLDSRPYLWKIVRKSGQSVDENAIRNIHRDHVLILQSGKVVHIEMEWPSSWRMVNEFSSHHSIACVTAFRGNIFGVEKIRNKVWLVCYSGHRWERKTNLRAMSGRSGTQCPRQFFSQIGDEMCLLDEWISVQSVSDNIFRERHVIQSYFINEKCDEEKGEWNVVISKGSLSCRECAGFVRGFSAELL